METELCPVCGESVEDCPSVLVDGQGKFPRYRLSCEVRRAEIGALVERMCRNGSLNGPLKVFPSRLLDGPVRVSLVTCASGVRNGEASTLLDALRALVKEVGGD